MPKLFATSIFVKTIPSQTSVTFTVFDEDGHFLRNETLLGAKSLTVELEATFESSGKFEFSDEYILNKLNEVLKEIEFPEKEV